MAMSRGPRGRARPRNVGAAAIQLLALASAPLGCSSGSSASPDCDTDGGLHDQGGFCVFAEAPPSTSGGTFSHDVQPILTHYCGVVGCHVSGSPAGALNLAPGFSYDDLLKDSIELRQLPDGGGPVKRVVPGDLDTSYLDIKINRDRFNAVVAALGDGGAAGLGSTMPAMAATGSDFGAAQIKVIEDWIQNNAPNDSP